MRQGLDAGDIETAVSSSQVHLVSRVVAAVSGTTSLRAGLRVMLQTLCDELGADHGAVLQVRESISGPFVAATWGAPPYGLMQSLWGDGGWARPVGVERRPWTVLVGGSPGGDGEGARPAMVLPIEFPGDVPTWVVFARAPRLQPFREADLRWVGEVTEVLAHVCKQLDREDGLRRALSDAERHVADSRAAQRARSAFFANMGHDLRTPLSAILGFAQLMEMKLLPVEEHAEAVRHILEGGRILEGRINAILELTRLDAGKITLGLEPVDVAAVIEEGVAQVQDQARLRQMRIEVKVDAGHSPLIILADRRRLQQVLNNLISNAVVHNVDGGRVLITAVTTGDARVRLSVRDTGPGIAKERLGTIFFPFERAQTDPNRRGTGMSLSLSHALAQAMGGSLRVATRLGQGSIFTLEMPGRPAATHG